MAEGKVDEQTFPGLFRDQGKPALGLASHLIQQLGMPTLALWLTWVILLDDTFENLLKAGIERVKNRRQGCQALKRWLRIDWGLQQ